MIQNMTLRVVMILLMITGLSAGITHLTQKNFNEKVQSKEYVLVYVYSSSCNFCKEFTPKYQELSQYKPLQHLDLLFAKMDGPAY